MMIDKKTMTLLLAVFLYGCSQQELNIEKGVVTEHDSSLGVELRTTTSDSVQYFFEQARFGIGDAYVKMAHYYRDGTLGKPDILKVMQMGFMAEEYMAIPNVDALFKDVADNDSLKIVYQALNLLNKAENLDSLSDKAEELVVRGFPVGYSIQAMIAYKNNDRDKAIALCEKGIEGGCTFAGITKDIILSSENYGEDLKPETLLKIANGYPMAYRMLGDYYAKIPNDSISDVPLAMHYYLKASEHACLGRREALWILEAIYIKGFPAVDSLIDKRLWSLGRNEINDSVIWLP